MKLHMIITEDGQRPAPTVKVFRSEYEAREAFVRLVVGDERIDTLGLDYLGMVDRLRSDFFAGASPAGLYDDAKEVYEALTVDGDSGYPLHHVCEQDLPDEHETGDNDERIIELARNQYPNEEKYNFDDRAVVSEGDDNGAYVQAWVWVDFSGTALDKEA